MDMQIIPSLEEAEHLYKRTKMAHLIVKMVNVGLFLVLPIIGYFLYYMYITLYQSCLVTGILMLIFKIIIDNQLAVMSLFTNLVSTIMAHAAQDKLQNKNNNPYATSKYAALRNIYKLTY